MKNKAKTKTTFYLRCNTYAVNAGSGLCTPHSNNLEKTTDIIINQIRQRCTQLLNEEHFQELADRHSTNVFNSRHYILQEIYIVENKISNINKQIDQIYDDRYREMLSDTDYSRLYTKYADNRKELEEELQSLEQSREKNDNKVDIKRLVKNFVRMKDITRTVLVSLVDRIEISKDNEITIHYKFNILNFNNKNIGNDGTDAK
jgi:hypothetical protein